MGRWEGENVVLRFAALLGEGGMERERATSRRRRWLVEATPPLTRTTPKAPRVVGRREEG